MAIEVSHINESEYNEILQQAVAVFDSARERTHNRWKLTSRHRQRTAEGSPKGHETNC